MGTWGVTIINHCPKHIQQLRDVFSENKDGKITIAMAMKVQRIIKDALDNPSSKRNDKVTQLYSKYQEKIESILATARSPELTQDRSPAYQG